MRIIVPLVFVLAGCSGAQIAAALKAADAVGRGIANVAGWCEENGAKPADVVATVESAKKGDYQQALDLAARMVSELKRSGVKVPDETATMLELAQQAYAAKALEQGLRALSGKNPDGSSK